MHTREEKMAAFARLLDVQDELRKKCPWDSKQTFDSLRPNTIEEVYELCDAVMDKDWKNVCKELGDMMEHVIFYGIMGDEIGEFDIADVCNREADKLIFRHPNIYPRDEEGTPAGVPKTEAEMLKLWEQTKQKEKDGNKTVLSGVPKALPSLIKAFRITEKASNVGFDWQVKEDVWDKVHEEIDELREELAKGDAEKSLDELGDFFFALVNAARKYNLNPDTALERSNQKFINRFTYIEQKAKEQGRSIKDLTLAEMDELWEEAK